jgi:hypothetical protein
MARQSESQFFFIYGRIELLIDKIQPLDGFIDDQASITQGTYFGFWGIHFR